MSEEEPVIILDKEETKKISEGTCTRYGRVFFCVEETFLGIPVASRDGQRCTLREFFYPQLFPLTCSSTSSFWNLVALPLLRNMTTHGTESSMGHTWQDTSIERSGCGCLGALNQMLN